MQGIKAIKALVAFMAVLLLAGLGLVGYGVATKTGQGSKTRAVAAAPSAGGFGTVSVPLPAGAHVEQALVAGERVVLRVTGAGAERLIVLDPGDGSIAGSFVLSPEAPAGR